MHWGCIASDVPCLVIDIFLNDPTYGGGDGPYPLFPPVSLFSGKGKYVVSVTDITVIDTILLLTTHGSLIFATSTPYFHMAASRSAQ